MVRASRWVSVGVAVLMGCSSEVTPSESDPDPHPSFPEDAEIAEDADVPLLPPIVDDADASLADDVPAAEDAPPAPTDGPRSIDAPAPQDVPTAPPRCTGSASGQSAVWTCTRDGDARERCVSGRVDREACANGCVRRDGGANDTCAPGTAPALVWVDG